MLKSTFNQMGNFFVGALLRSPLHGMLSKSTALISVTGRRSQKTYTTPVNYALRDDVVWIASQRERTWWKNLRGGAKMAIRLLGRDHQGWGDVQEGSDQVERSLEAYFEAAPSFANYYGVELDGDGNPSPDAVKRAAAGRVAIRIQLEPEG